MKLLLTLSITMLLSGLVYSQDFDSRLLAKYSQSELTEMKSTSPDEYKLLVYALDHAIYIAENGNAKGNQLEQVTLPAGSYTFLDLGLQIKDQNQYFLIAGENKMLVVKSKWVLNHEMEKK
jgi:LEA14-like dessication related protein